jgi:hypothetical protein
MSWVTTSIFYNIASIREVEPSGDGAKGSIFGILKELEFAVVESSSLRRRKKEERSKEPIKNLSETSSQKSEKNLVGMSLLEQTPCFTTKKHVSTMYS